MKLIKNLHWPCPLPCGARRGLGILVVECCTGRPPWEGAQTFALLDNIVDGEPPTLPESFTPDAKAFVRSCLEKDHERRADSDAMAVHPWVAGASRDWTRRVAEWLEGVP
jgi:mitogen-activated protein kinase kinase